MLNLNLPNFGGEDREGRESVGERNERAAARELAREAAREAARERRLEERALREAERAAEKAVREEERVWREAARAKAVAEREAVAARVKAEAPGALARGFGRKATADTAGAGAEADASVAPTIDPNSAYARVQRARHKDRPTAVEFIANCITDFSEMHGDRRFGDDRAIIAGVGYLGGQPVTVIAIEKGRTAKDRADRQFGSPHPEGYRKAMRQMALAEKFGRPVLCFVDTPGAHPGIGAEERGQGQAIAESLMTMMDLSVPAISIVLGEGGSGGALALAVADEVWMLENAVYSVISPEGCASILWRDAKRAPEAAEYLKMTSDDLLANGVVDGVIPEPAEELTQLHGGGLSPHAEVPDFAPVYAEIVRRAGETFAALSRKTADERRAARYERFRKLGG